MGLANYREAIHDAHFWQALCATARFVVMASPLTIFFALLPALALNSIPDRRQNAYRLMIFLPAMITISVAGLIWRWLYSTEFGLFNVILSHVGIKVPWLTDTAMAMKSVVICDW